MCTSQLTVAGYVLGCWVDGSTKANPVWLRSGYFHSWYRIENKWIDSVAENVSSPLKHSACFLTDVLSCDSIFLPQWDPDTIPVGTGCLWLLCWPCRGRCISFWESCPFTGVWRVKALQQDETLSCWDNEESVWEVSVSINDERKAFLLPGQVGMENLMSPGIGQVW